MTPVFKTCTWVYWGDIRTHPYPTVEVPSTVFHLVGSPVRVPTLGAMGAHLAAWDDKAVPLGPFNDENEPETEVVRPRNVQVIPGHYASLLIHRRGVSAKVAYQELQELMQAAWNEMDLCRDVLTWLRAACTARGGGELQNSVPVVYHPLAAVHLPEAVYQYLTSKVLSNLPALAEPNSASAELTGTLAGALRALTRTSGGTDEEERGSREPKSIQEVYRETFSTLLRYCNVAQADRVAPLWRQLANCTKSEQYTILSQEFQRMCGEQKLATDIYVPVVTTALKQMITGFQFVGHGVDDLGSGCQPFQVVYSGGANHVEALEVASLSNQLNQGNHNANLSDVRTIREKEILKFLTDISQTCITLYRFAVLCQAMFQDVSGPENPLVAAQWKLADGGRGTVHR